MGNRISISFEKDNQESVTLFSHWDGKLLVEKAEHYIEKLNKDIKNNKISKCTPLARLEPGTVMVDFIRSYTKKLERIDSNLYLGKNSSDGDNSDNGHQIIIL